MPRLVALEARLRTGTSSTKLQRINAVLAGRSFLGSLAGVHSIGVLAREPGSLENKWSWRIGGFFALGFPFLVSHHAH